MPWVLIDILIGLLAVGVLAAVCLTGYRRVKALIRTGKQAGERIGAVTSQLDELQRQGASSRTP